MRIRPELTSGSGQTSTREVIYQARTIRRTFINMKRTTVNTRRQKQNQIVMFNDNGEVVDESLRQSSEDSTGSECEIVSAVTDNKDTVDSYIKKGKTKRIFAPKESILTYLCASDKNVEAFYHVFMVMICTGIIYSLVKDSVEAGKPSVDMGYYVSGFGPMQKQLIAAIMWLPLKAAVLLVYPSFILWMYLHPTFGRLANVVFICLFIAYNIGAHTLAVYSITHFDLPPVPALFLSVEQLRWTMKSYSFIRENAYKILYPWHKDDKTGPAVWYEGQMEPHVGSFSAYIYFLFCPTLLYRDRYPRTSRVRPFRVLAHLIKCCVSLTFVVILCKEIFDSYPKIVSSQPMSFSREVFLLTFLTCTLWGLVFQFMAGYFFLHSWLNLWGEILQFADREFYSDWWTCTSFSAFYRKWNLVVHDWIKAYIYQDLKDLFHSRWYSRVASIPTIIISALFHEYVLWAPVRFVLPLLLIMFGVFGGILYFFQPNTSTHLWNYFLHFGLQLGVSMMLFVYATEFYARKTCVQEETLISTFVPRFYNCFFYT